MKVLITAVAVFFAITSFALADDCWINKSDKNVSLKDGPKIEGWGRGTYVLKTPKVTKTYGTLSGGTGITSFGLSDIADINTSYRVDTVDDDGKILKSTQLAKSFGLKSPYFILENCK